MRKVFRERSGLQEIFRCLCTLGLRPLAVIDQFVHRVPLRRRQIDDAGTGAPDHAALRGPLLYLSMSERKARKPVDDLPKLAP